MIGGVIGGADFSGCGIHCGSETANWPHDVRPIHTLDFRV